MPNMHSPTSTANLLTNSQILQDLSLNAPKEAEPFEVIDLTELSDGDEAMEIAQDAIDNEKAVKRFQEALDEEFPYHQTKKVKKQPKAEAMFDYFVKHRITDASIMLRRPVDEWRHFQAMRGFQAMAASYYTTVSALLGQTESFWAKLEAPEEGFDDFEPDKISDFLFTVHGWSQRKIDFFVMCLLKVASNGELRSPAKKNTLFISGTPSSGKSALIESFVRTFFAGVWGQPNNNLRSQFTWNDLVGKACCLWEEPVITSDNVEDVKKIFGGQHHKVEQKYAAPADLSPMPCFITSNRSLGNLAQQNYLALKERCYAFSFGTKIDEEWGRKNLPFTKEDFLHLFKRHWHCVKIVKENPYAKFLTTYGYEKNNTEEN